MHKFCCYRFGSACYCLHWPFFFSLGRYDDEVEFFISIVGLPKPPFILFSIYSFLMWKRYLKNFLQFHKKKVGISLQRQLKTSGEVIGALLSGSISISSPFFFFTQLPHFILKLNWRINVLPLCTLRHFNTYCNIWSTPSSILSRWGPPVWSRPCRMLANSVSQKKAAFSPANLSTWQYFWGILSTALLVSCQCSVIWPYRLSCLSMLKCFHLIH